MRVIDKQFDDLRETLMSIKEVQNREYSLKTLDDIQAYTLKQEALLEEVTDVLSMQASNKF